MGLDMLATHGIGQVPGRVARAYRNKTAYEKRVVNVGVEGQREYVGGTVIADAGFLMDGKTMYYLVTNNIPAYTKIYKLDVTTGIETLIASFDFYSNSYFKYAKEVQKLLVFQQSPATLYVVDLLTGTFIPFAAPVAGYSGAYPQTVDNTYLYWLNGTGIYRYNYKAGGAVEKLATITLHNSYSSIASGSFKNMMVVGNQLATVVRCEYKSDSSYYNFAYAIDATTGNKLGETSYMGIPIASNGDNQKLLFSANSDTNLYIEDPINSTRTSLGNQHATAFEFSWDGAYLATKSGVVTIQTGVNSSDLAFSSMYYNWGVRPTIAPKTYSFESDVLVTSEAWGDRPVWNMYYRTHFKDTPINEAFISKSQTRDEGYDYYWSQWVDSSTFSVTGSIGRVRKNMLMISEVGEAAPYSGSVHFWDVGALRVKAKVGIKPSIRIRSMTTIPSNLDAYVQSMQASDDALVMQITGGHIWWQDLNDLAKAPENVKTFLPNSETYSFFETKNGDGRGSIHGYDAFFYTFPGDGSLKIRSYHLKNRTVTADYHIRSFNGIGLTNPTMRGAAVTNDGKYIYLIIRDNADGVDGHWMYHLETQTLTKALGINTSGRVYGLMPCWDNCMGWFVDYSTSTTYYDTAPTSKGTFYNRTAYIYNPATGEHLRGGNCDRWIGRFVDGNPVHSAVQTDQNGTLHKMLKNGARRAIGGFYSTASAGNCIGLTEDGKTFVHMYPYYRDKWYGELHLYENNFDKYAKL
ncbi:hypothetical protein [Tumebacillus lipolyticus]|uniref:Uncharacterized protein n=1 Tax=Tumebacillus lipolyticus TaxID=1280370 RepID=A0ABW4ZXF2_9BACL